MRIVRRLQFLVRVFGIVVDYNLQRTQDAHHSRGGHVEIVPDTVFELSYIHMGIDSRDTNQITELSDCGGSDAAPAQPDDGWHAGIVPSGYVPLFDQADEFSLTQHRVIEIEPGKFSLLGRFVYLHTFQDPVIELAIVLELEGAQGMRDAFNGVREAMGEIIHRVNAPLVARAIMMGVSDSIQDRIAHDHVRRRHVDSGPQDMRAVLKLAGSHPRKEIETLADRPVPIGTLATVLGNSPSVLANLAFSRAVNVCLPTLDELYRVVVQPLEVIRGVERRITPIKAEPANIILN